MKQFLTSASLIFLFTIGAAGQNQTSQALAPAKLLDEVNLKTGWASTTSPRSLDPNEFAALKPSQAAILSEYGYRHIVPFSLKKGNLFLNGGIYEMLDSPAAYGVFTFYRSSDAQTRMDLGNMASVRPDEISFIQNRYYVQLQSIQTGANQTADLFEIARIISHSLPRGLSLPSLLGKLPEQGHLKNSTVYMMGPLALDTKLHVNNQDIFGLSDGAESLWADYRDADSSASLLLFQYPTQQLAKMHLESGSKQFNQLHPHENLIYKREGPLVALVIGRPSPLADRLLEQVNYTSTVSLDPKVNPLTVAKLMLNAFLFIGIALLITLGGGICFGSTRILVKKFFPGKIFDRPEGELIHLDLQPKSRDQK
jgi:hypothetical protein